MPNRNAKTDPSDPYPTRDAGLREMAKGVKSLKTNNHAKSSNFIVYTMISIVLGGVRRNGEMKSELSR